jgi:hypothetical protein
MSKTNFSRATSPDCCASSSTAIPIERTLRVNTEILDEQIKSLEQEISRLEGFSSCLTGTEMNTSGKSTQDRTPGLLEYFSGQIDRLGYLNNRLNSLITTLVERVG